MNPQPKPQRVKLKPYEYSKLKTDIWVARGCICEKCFTFLPRKQAHLHHIKRKSQGGSDEWDNLELICYDCHRAIHDGRLE